MARFTIYSPTGTALYTGTPSFTGQYMKPGLLEFREVSVPTLLTLEPGCYVDYARTGYRYRIYTAPQIKKQARRATYGGAFVFQGVQLYDASKQLEYCPFRDLVKGDNRIHFSTQPSISTFEGVDGLARRFEACLRDQYDVEGVQSWAVRIATPERDGVDSALYEMMLEPREFTVSGVNILECLDKVYEIWPDVGWVYKVENGIDTIVIGGGGINANSGTYAYGKGRGLTSLTRVAANAEEIANRIFAYGSNQNMLPRWYNSQQIKDAESVDIQNLMLPIGRVGTYPGWGLTDDLPDAAKAFVENAASIAKNGLRPATVYFDGSGEYPAIYPSIRETTIGMVRTAIGDPTAKYYPSTAIYDDADARIDQVLTAPAVFDSGKAGADGKSSTDVGYIAYEHSSATPITIPARSVHTEAFASGTIALTGTGRLNIEVSYPGIGILTGCGAVYLDFSLGKVHGGETTTIYTQRVVMNPGDAGSHSVPEGRISYTGNAVFEAGDSLSVVVNLVLNNQAGAVDTTAFLTNASGTMTVKAANHREKTFTISLRQIGFDINEQAALGDGKTIAMRSGKCAGRSFAIKSVQYNSTNDCWDLECWRTEDESLSQWFPNTDYPVEADDEFVLLDIAMPETYIGMAEAKLLQAAQELLADTAVERWQYTPEIDAKYMIENNRVIQAGDFMVLIDNDLIDGSGGGGEPGELVYFQHSGGGYFLTKNGEKIAFVDDAGAVRIIVDTIVINEGEAAIPTYKVTLRDRKKKTWTTSESAPTSSSKSVGNTREAEAATLEAESFFMLDTDGNVTLKAAYQNLWVPGWLAAGGVGSGGGGGGGVSYLRQLTDVYHSETSILRANGSAAVEGDALVYNPALGWVAASVSVSGVVKKIACGSYNNLTPDANGLVSITNAVVAQVAYWCTEHITVRRDYGPNQGTKIATIGIDNDYYTIWAPTGGGSGGGYIGYTSVQSSAGPLNLYGIPYINATNSASSDSRMVWDSTNNAWHFYGNIYADGWIAAGGIGSGGGGGGYVLPIASASTLGGIKVGSGLSINASGVLSVTGGGGGGGSTVEWGQTGEDFIYLSVDGTAKKLLTAHQSLSNYVTLNTDQNNISGAKTFTTKTNFTGGLAVPQTAYIDLGPIRIKFENNALHITKVDPNDNTNYGLYADGFVSAGGVPQNA